MNAVSSRTFSRMPTPELLKWRPAGYGHARDISVSHANREYRRRTAKEGFATVHDWMRKHLGG